MKFAPLVMSLLAAAIIYAPSAEAAPSAKRSGSSIQIKEAVDDNAISVINAEKAKLQKGLVKILFLVFWSIEIRHKVKKNK